MIKKWIISVLLLAGFFASTANAAFLQIENAFVVKCERWHQFRAVLYLDNGARLDVTRNAYWSSFGNQMRQAGEFYFEFPDNARGARDYQKLFATVYYAGYQFNAGGTVNIDLSPDYTEIIGPRSSTSRGSVNYQAFGVYPGKRVELTDRGVWSAEHGDIDDQGRYLAPSVSRGSTLEDLVNFQFGIGRGQVQVQVSNAEE